MRNSGSGSHPDCVGKLKLMCMMKAAMSERTIPKPRLWKPVYVSDGQIVPSWSGSKKSTCCCRTVWCACLVDHEFARVPEGWVCVAAMLTRAVP
jgi:hypothetical protein